MIFEQHGNALKFITQFIELETLTLNPYEFWRFPKILTLVDEHDYNDHHENKKNPQQWNQPPNNQNDYGIVLDMCYLQTPIE